MLETLKQAPFIRLTLVFISGIILQLCFNPANQLVLGSLLITFTLSFSLVEVTKFSANYRLRWMYGICIHCFFLSLGIVLTAQKLQPAYNWKYDEGKISMIGSIIDGPLPGPKTVRFLIIVNAIYMHKVWKPCNEKLLVHISKDFRSQHLMKGDRILIQSVVKKPEPSYDPGDMDYQKYLYYKGVRALTFADSAHWKSYGASSRLFYERWADKMRCQLKALLSQSGLKGGELAVAISLLIGDQTGIDSDIKSAYKASGTMHVLAVSGMHVALIYQIVLMLSAFLEKIRYGKIMRCIIILMVIWIYALITDLSPSVLRATVMFSFIVSGLASNRVISIFNSLFASAFFLLLINPLNLIDIGFQLSYLAVGGIVILYPCIYHLWEIQNKTGNLLWSLTSVTLAAQISTTPISLYYFHQFPNLFLVSNLIVVPLSSIVIYAGLILTLLSVCHLFVFYAGKVLFWLIWSLNSIVKAIEKIPCSVTEGLYPTISGTILAYLLIICLSLFIFKKQRSLLIGAMTILVIMLSANTWDAYQLFRSHEMIVFHEKGNAVVQFREGRQSVWIVEKDTQKFRKNVKYAVQARHSDKNIFLWMSELRRDSAIKTFKPFPDLFIKGTEVIFYGQKHSLGPSGNHIVSSSIP